MSHMQARSNGFHIGATIYGAPKVRMRAPNARSFARGVRGHAPPEKFLKNGAIWWHLVHFPGGFCSAEIGHFIRRIMIIFAFMP